jgi:hypothetical protein
VPPRYAARRASRNRPIVGAGHGVAWHSSALAICASWKQKLAGASRYHGGLNSDEFAAILQRGERVLTANQNDRMAAAMKGLIARGEKSGGTAPTIVFNISTPNADSFQRSQSQIMARAGAMIGVAQRRNGS